MASSRFSPPGDRQRLLPSYRRNDHASYRHRLERHAESSDPDTFDDVPLVGAAVTTASPTLPAAGSHYIPSSQPWSPSRPDPTTAARFGKIRADTERNQQQIENLTEAHHDLRDAVSGIAATQGLLRFSEGQPTGMPTDV